VAIIENRRMDTLRDQIKKYEGFLYSYYLSGAVRITAGIVLPAIVLNYFNLLPVGITASLGALVVSATDNPGPIHHRRNGMLICVLVIFVVALLTGLASPFPVILGGFIFICCFLFSMIGVYGSRANSIGVAALLVMVLQTAQIVPGSQVLMHSVYILAGGLWYAGLSMLLYKFRPYKLAQQALGECIAATADYLRIRAAFYEPSVDFDKVYRQMVEQQVDVHQQQDLVRELLFKSRRIVKESTRTGQTLLLMFSNLVDLFEQIMTSYQDYRELHKAFDNTNILPQYHRLILMLADELDDIGIAVKSGRRSRETGELTKAIASARDLYNETRDKSLTTGNIENFIQLRHILESIEDIADRLHTLHLYVANELELPKKAAPAQDYKQFLVQQDFRPELLIENLTLQSNFFRHALRVSIATLAGYIVSNMLDVGHGYWILLTIVVILKPTYSLTKQRNFDRVLGTVAGALLGLLVLHFIKNNTVLFIIMIALMVGTYSLLQVNYRISVILMTPYVLLMFHLLYSGPIKNILIDRLLDTGIGSGIAFIASFLLVPVWEQLQIRNYIAASLENNRLYFREVAASFTGQAIALTQYKVSRKNAYVALANLSDAFTRMLSEPRSRQKNIARIHSLVVINHQLTSHIAALAQYAQQWAEKYAASHFTEVINTINAELEGAKIILETATVTENALAVTPRQLFTKQVEQLMNKRREELEQGLTDTPTRHTLFEYKSIVDQFDFICRLAIDSKKISAQLTER
jgi:uncharacterized membrane protein (TIGR01666 family)